MAAGSSSIRRPCSITPGSTSPPFHERRKISICSSSGSTIPSGPHSGRQISAAGPDASNHAGRDLGGAGPTGARVDAVSLGFRGQFFGNEDQSRQDAEWINIESDLV